MKIKSKNIHECKKTVISCQHESERFITTNFMWHARTPLALTHNGKNSKSIIYHVLFIIVGCKCFAHFSSSPHNKYQAHNYRVPKIRILCCCFNTMRINNKLSNFIRTTMLVQCTKFTLNVNFLTIFFFNDVKSL